MKLVAVIGLSVVVAGSVACGPSSGSAATPSDILWRSVGAMARIHSVHATGGQTERQVEIGDARSTGSWHIAGDCASSGAVTLSRFSYGGSQTGRHPRSVHAQYVVRVPTKDGGPAPRYVGWRVWSRPLHPLGSWHRVDVTHDARIVPSMCPSLIIRQLRARLPGPVKEVGRPRIAGREAIHLVSSFEGEGGGRTVELFVDAASFRWLRVRLSDWGAGCCHAESYTFDYSRYNLPARIKAPPVRDRRQASHSAVEATATIRGIKVTMSVPHRRYPRGALVSVHIVDVNMLGHPVRVPRARGYLCTGAIVSDYSTSGRQMYPPVLAGEPVAYCPQAFPSVRLAPHAAYSWYRRVILRGPILHVGLFGFWPGQRSPPRIVLRLANARGPLSIRIRRKPGLEATISGADGRRLYYYSVTSCTSDSATETYSSGFTGWQAAGRNVIHPSFLRSDSRSLTTGCSGRTVWRFVAGVPGLPVVSAHYDSTA